MDKELQRQLTYLAKFKNSDIANVLERVAREMHERHTTDGSNSLIIRSMVMMADEGDPSVDALSDGAVVMFLHVHTPFWRHYFRAVEHKVLCYLIAAAMARSMDDPPEEDGNFMEGYSDSDLKAPDGFGDNNTTL